ncbi:MAG TPA: serine hydroxymethyltransferase [Streptosporangiaceae bacterium]|jgi:glycine hydroxymethyltransferase
MAASSQSLDFLLARGIGETDPELAGLLTAELDRQRGQIELVASENFTWTGALQAMASPGANKLADGYPGHRETGGCERIDAIEQMAIGRLLDLFGAEHANVQTHSGAQANMAVYFACLEPGDTMLAMSVQHGGHHTHGQQGNFSGRFYRVVSYGVERDTGLIDFAQVRALAREHRPKLIVCGGSAYPRQIDWAAFRQIADEAGAYLLCDMAHVAGLVAAGLHPSPVAVADFITSTVHKTLAGPRCGGFVLCRREHAAAIDQAVSPGTQSAPFPHLIAAKAVCFKAAASEAFRGYQRQVCANASALAGALAGRGLGLLAGGTDTHLLMLELSAAQPGAQAAEQLLASAGITVSKYPVPFDPRLPAGVSGLRMGTPAITMRGFTEAATRAVGEIIADALAGNGHPGLLRERARALCDQHPLYPGWRGYFGLGG